MENNNELEQKNEIIRNLLWNDIQKTFGAFSESVKNLPVAQHVKLIVLQHADTAYLWAKEACGSINFQAAPQPNLQAVEQPTNDEVKQEEVAA